MLLYQNALIAAFSAAIMAILVTRAIEKLGGVLGGVIAAMPLTIISAVAGWYYALSFEDFQRACFFVPTGMLNIITVLVCWRYIPGKFLKFSNTNRLLITVFGSLLFWLIGAVAEYLLFLYAIPKEPLATFYVGLGSFLIHISFSIYSSQSNPEAPKGKKRVTWTMLCIRGLAAFVIIFITVYLSNISSILAGILSTFPVIFTTTMVSLWISQGSAVQLGAIGPLMLGSSSVGFYAIVTAFLSPITGLIGASFLAYGLSIFLIGFPSLFFLKRQGAKLTLATAANITTTESCAREVRQGSVIGSSVELLEPSIVKYTINSDIILSTKGITEESNLPFAFAPQEKNNAVMNKKETLTQIRRESIV